MLKLFFLMTFTRHRTSFNNVDLTICAQTMGHKQGFELIVPALVLSGASPPFRFTAKF